MSVDLLFVTLRKSVFHSVQRWRRGNVVLHELFLVGGKEDRQQTNLKA